jgi:hypothetical protein
MLFRTVDYGGFSWASNKIVPESSLTVRLDIVKTDCLNTIITEIRMSAKHILENLRSGLICGLLILSN